jgi:hypothetical protein
MVVAVAVGMTAPPVDQVHGVPVVADAPAQ